MRPLKTKYKYLFFDLDHTLWDYTTNSREALEELYQKHRLEQLGGFCPARFCSAFDTVNKKLWGLNESGRISKDELRRQRFVRVLAALGHGQVEEDLTAGLDRDFMALCPAKPGLLPFAREVLEHFHGRMPLYILTNGFLDVQAIKLRSAGIAHYFTAVFTAEDAGVAKPDVDFFRYVLKRIGARPDDCLMIGDNLKADVIGATTAGIDSVYYNPHKRKYHVPVQRDIQCLSELLKLF